MTVFKKIQTVYRKLNLQKKLSIIVVMAVLIPMILIITIFSGRLFNMITSDTIRQEQNSASKTAPLVESIVQNILNTCSEIKDSEPYKNIFGKKIYDNFSQMLTSTDFAELLEVLQSAEDSDVISSVRIYADISASEPSLAGYNNYIAPFSDIKGTYWYGIFQGSHPSELFCPPLYLSHHEAQSVGDCAYIIPSRILTVDSGTVNCYLALYFHSDMIENLLNEHLINDGSLSYITNERDAVITTSDDNMLGLYYVNYDSIRDNLMSSNSFIEKNITGNHVFVGFYYIESADWFMVTVLPNGPIMAKALQMMGIFFSVCLISIIAGLLVSLYLSRSLTRRISAVSHQMSLVKTDTPPVIMSESESVDEIGELVDSYNYMVRKINRLIAEQAKSAEELRISEFNSLQAQINPHFLYNTMDMINWKAQQGKKEEITSAIRDLSRFYKLTLSRKHTITTIADEIEHASIYMRLQNMRFGGMIDFVVDIPDSMLDIHIPTLIFQPIIENSLLHGILEKESKTGSIVITGWLEDEAAIIMISDDGVGIPSAKLRTLLSEKDKQLKKKDHIAIYNTHRRLQILYGPSYGLSYQSTPGTGTDVTIRLPRYEKDTSLLHTGYHDLPGQDEDHLSLLTVPTGTGSGYGNPVAPEQLYGSNIKHTQQVLNVENFHNVFHGFPPNGNIFLITHYINEIYPVHSHNYFEANYVCRGSLINKIEGKDIYMDSGNLILMNRKARHSLIPLSGDCLLLNICIRKEMLRKLLRHTKGGTPIRRLASDKSSKGCYLFYPLKQNQKFQVLLFSILQVYSAERFRETAELIRLFSKLINTLSISGEYSTQGPDRETFKIIRYLHKSSITSINDISSELGIPSGQIQEQIKLKYGREIESILREKRLERAVEMLSDKRINIFLIAEKCGYNSIADFSSDFRECYGTSPEEYREQLI